MPPETAELPTPTRPLPRLVGLISVPVPRPATGRSPRRRARAAVLFGAVLYLLIQAGLNGAIRAEWLPVRDPIFAEKFALLRQHPRFFGHLDDGQRPDASPRLLAIGSSRTQLGFDARRVMAVVARLNGCRIEAFNFGCPAAGPMTCAVYLRRLLDAGVSPEFVTVEIHPGFVSRLDPPYESRWLHAYRLRPHEVETLSGFGWAIDPPPQHGWQGWVAASHAYRHALVDHFAPVMLLCPFGLNVGAVMDGRGFVAGKDWPPDKKPDQIRRTRDEYAPTFEGYATGGPGVAAVRDMLAVCRRHGIRAAVVLMPESAEYRGWYGAEGLRRVGELAAELSAEFAVPVADARDWVPDDGFADGHHLTAAGSAVFAERLARELIGPWVARNATPRPSFPDERGVTGDYHPATIRGREGEGSRP